MKNLWKTIADFFDLIPKVIYFLYASLASAVDAMQALIRKLAGLDVYYTEVGEAIRQRDPLTEFIYGILGYGENAAVYKGLNTAFWSLVIFAVIMLAVCTMIAIVKSHYNEDTAGTSPWKYIYQAIKAVLTFVALPAIILLGMKLNTFVLTTLDKITAGTVGEQQVKDVYGENAATKFVAGTLNGTTDTKSYIYYDYFGAGDPTTSTTFSGMLFKAAAYNANRARSGSVSYSNYGNIKIQGQSIFADSGCANYTQASDKQEYVAYQIDFAFQNNLHLASRMQYSDIKEATGLKVSSAADMFAYLASSQFSKFNPAIVWQFYNLWQFNYIIGFAAVFAVFAMMISIVLGLMSRLIKGAALFMIYPTLLGLAPLDNFKAFKDWGSQFLKQVLMAIGSIIGVNLLLLILPYVQTLKFFNIPIIDTIINVLLLIVGLSMAKDFISMVSGFVGGADALGAGGGLKGDISGNLKKGLGTSAKIGMGTARVMGKAANSVFVKPIKKATAGHRANKQRERANEAAGNAENAQKATEQAIQKRRDYMLRDEGALTRAGDASKKAMDDYKKTHKDASTDELNEVGRKAFNSELDKIAGEWDKAGEGEKSFMWKGLQTNIREAQNTQGKAEKEYNIAKDKEEQIVKKYGLQKKAGEDVYASTNPFTKDEESKAMLKQARADKRQGQKENFEDLVKGMGRKFTDSVDATSLGKTLADVFTKNAQNIAGNMGFDKAMNGAKDILKGTFTFKGGAFDAKPELSGDKLAKANAAEAQKQQEKTNELLTKLVSKQEETEKNTRKSAAAAESAANKSSSKGSGLTGGDGK